MDEEQLKHWIRNNIEVRVNVGYRNYEQNESVEVSLRILGDREPFTSDYHALPEN
jgi:hypothetical protein